MKTSGLLTTCVNVSTVGPRNEITLPRIIIKRANLSNKRPIYLFPVDENDTLGISPRPPVKRPYRKIWLSRKGQFIIPGFLRKSRGITTGTNLMFLYNGSEILVTILSSRVAEKERENNWKPFTESLVVN
ncbi:MAG: hypothetical protein ACXAEU_05050 [Candidatus Hodarchaeales archaeon]|jgi:hypothetical protein